MSDVRVNWFEIPVTDLDRAVGFYSTVLEREFGEIDGPNGPMKVFNSPEGSAGTLTVAESEPAAGGVVIYLNCPDIDSALGRVAAAGGEVLQPRTPIGPFGFIGKFQDTEGNAVALHTPPAS